MLSLLALPVVIPTSFRYAPVYIATACPIQVRISDISPTTAIAQWRRPYAEGSRGLPYSPIAVWHIRLEGELSTEDGDALVQVYKVPTDVGQYILTRLYTCNAMPTHIPRALPLPTRYSAPSAPVPFSWSHPLGFRIRLPALRVCYTYPCICLRPQASLHPSVFTAALVLYL